MTYVPSENQSLAQLIPDEGPEPGITVEIKPEVLFIVAWQCTSPPLTELLEKHGYANIDVVTSGCQTTKLQLVTPLNLSGGNS